MSTLQGHAPRQHGTARRSVRAAFTLVELLTVVAISALVANAGADIEDSLMASWMLKPSRTLSAMF